MANHSSQPLSAVVSNQHLEVFGHTIAVTLRYRRLELTRQLRREAFRSRDALWEGSFDHAQAGLATAAWTMLSNRALRFAARPYAMPKCVNVRTSKAPESSQCCRWQSVLSRCLYVLAARDIFGLWAAECSCSTRLHCTAVLQTRRSQVYCADSLMFVALPSSMRRDREDKGRVAMASKSNRTQMCRRKECKEYNEGRVREVERVKWSLRATSSPLWWLIERSIHALRLRDSSG